jgi:hypothetical protein
MARGLERLAPREGEELAGQAGAAGHRLAHVLQHALAPARIGLTPEEVEAAREHHQQVVEVVRDAAGELAHPLQFLRLAQRVLGLEALGHLGEDLGIGVLQLAGALGDGALQPVVRAAQRGLRRLDLLQPGAGLVLSAAAAQGGARGADQCGGVEGTLQKGHVAEQRRDARHGRVALRPAAARRQQQHGEVGPGRLRGEPSGQRGQGGVAQRLVGDHEQARSLGEPVE